MNPLGLFSDKQKKWKLTDSETGVELLSFTSYVSDDVKDEGKVASEPVEKGSFATYNKTDSPVSIRSIIAMQGEDGTLQQAVTKLKELKSETKKFSLVTPTYEYQNMTLQSVNISQRREAGLGVLYAELTMVEVKEVEPAYSSVALPKKKVKNKNTASRVNGGQKQTKKTSALQSVLKKVL